MREFISNGLKEIGQEPKNNNVCEFEVERQDTNPNPKLDNATPLKITLRPM